MNLRVISLFFRNILILVPLLSIDDVIAPDIHGDICRSELCMCRLPEVVDCSRAKLELIPPKVPRDIESLYLTGNQLRHLRYAGFRALFQLRHLFLDNNQIAFVEPSTFRDLHQLTSLTLADNQLVRLNSDTFRRLTELSVLSLAKNQIKTIDERLFGTLVHLQLLNLGENRIERLNEDTFAANFQLRVLDLHSNHIRTIGRGTFAGMSKLKFLILRGNPLTDPDFRFSADVSLELLDLTDCTLTRIPRGLPVSVADIRLAENSIQSIEEKDFATTRSIRLLVLNDNMIDVIHPKALTSLKSLYDLHLTRNLVTTIPANLPTTLHGIYAAYNSISTLQTSALSKLGKLEHLVLKYNRIETIEPSALGGLRTIVSIDLSHNDIQIIGSSMFAKSVRLQKLDLSHNPLNRFETRCFRGLGELRILQMSSVDGPVDAEVELSVFKDLENLQYLDLSNSPRLVRRLLLTPRNKTTPGDGNDVESALLYVPDLLDLNLMHSNLSFLPNDVSRLLPRLRTVKLVGNPWRCDAGLRGLTGWMHTYGVAVYEQHRVVCQSPPELRGRRISELKDNELLPPTSPTTTSASSLVTTTTSIPITSAELLRTAETISEPISSPEMTSPQTMYLMSPTRSSAGMTSTSTTSLTEIVRSVIQTNPTRLPPLKMITPTSVMEDEDLDEEEENEKEKNKIISDRGKKENKEGIAESIIESVDIKQEDKKLQHPRRGQTN